MRHDYLWQAVEKIIVRVVAIRCGAPHAIQQCVWAVRQIVELVAPVDFEFRSQREINFRKGPEVSQSCEQYAGLGTDVALRRNEYVLGCKAWQRQDQAGAGGDEE